MGLREEDDLEHLQYKKPKKKQPLGHVDDESLVDNTEELTPDANPVLDDKPETDTKFRDMIKKSDDRGIHRK